MVSVAKYAERTKGFTTAKNVVNKESNTLADFSLEPHQSVVLELMK
jgi:hypothetical protein